MSLHGASSDLARILTGLRLRETVTMRVADKINLPNVGKRIGLFYTYIFCVVATDMLRYHPNGSSSCGAPCVEFRPALPTVQQWLSNGEASSTHGL